MKYIIGNNKEVDDKDELLFFLDENNFILETSIYRTSFYKYEQKGLPKNILLKCFHEIKFADEDRRKLIIPEYDDEMKKIISNFIKNDL